MCVECVICIGGEFGAYMQVHIQNDGPVTLHIESPKFPPPKEVCNQSPLCEEWQHGLFE